ncbi:MAG: hypothetical protein ACRDOJ_03555 [Nocardioidaceae bacterium]
MTLTPISTTPLNAHQVGATGALRVLAPRPRPPVSADDAIVVDNRPLRDRYWRLVLEAPDLAGAEPGQFAMVTVTRDASHGPVLPRPMAIYDVDPAAGHAVIVYSVVGEGTRTLAGFTTRQRIGVVGPLGRGFDLPSTGDVLLLGRGIGTCSLTLLAKAAADADVRVSAVASGRNPAAVIGTDIYHAADADALIVDDETGSSHPDVLRERLVDALDARPPSLVATCGSTRLQQLAGALARRWAADAQVSVEAHMACGLGYCHGCSTAAVDDDVEAPLVCRDGPVFLLQCRPERVPGPQSSRRCP